jgi:hypothetical protein
MASLNVNFTESTSSNDNSIDISHKDIASIRTFDIIVLQGHVSQVVEIMRAPIGTRTVINHT